MDYSSSSDDVVGDSGLVIDEPKSSAKLTKVLNLNALRCLIPLIRKIILL